MQYEAEINGRTRQVVVTRVGTRWEVTIDADRWIVDATRIDAHTLSLLVDGVGQVSHEVSVAKDQASGQLGVRVGPMPVYVGLQPRRAFRKKDEAAAGSGPQRIVAPMPGKIVKVLVANGDVVKARQGLVVVEAMKMENELKAAREGTVSDIRVREGESVEAGAPLLVIT